MMLEKVNAIVENMEVKENKMKEMLATADESTVEVFESYLELVSSCKKFMYDGATMMDQINFKTTNMDSKLNEMLKQLKD